MRRLAVALLHIGIVEVVAVLSKVHAVRNEYDYSGSSRFAWSISYGALLAVSAYGAGLPDVPRTLRSRLATSVAAAGTAALGMSVLQLATGDALLPRFVVFGSSLLLVPWYLACATVSARGRGRAEDRDRVVMIGAPAEAALLREELERHPERPALLVDAMTPQEAGPTAAGARPVVDRAVAARATVLVLDRDAQVDEPVVDQVATLHEAGVRVRTLSLFYEGWLGKLPVSELERVSLMFDIGEVHRARYGRAKRLVDVAVGLAGTAVLAAVAPLVLAGNVVANRGPLFYRQVRVGKNGRAFRILKFRTMTAAGEGDVAHWTTEDDPRITAFGGLLRRTHLDEVPQALNILKGDLSLVGPRPEQPHYVRELEAKIPFYALRHLVRPGLTGWAQVKYGYAGSESDALEKLQYEFFYLRRQGLGLDARIVGRTVRSVLGREGR